MNMMLEGSSNLTQPFNIPKYEPRLQQQARVIAYILS